MDHLVTCPVCFDPFDSDVSIFGSEEERRGSHLPVFSHQCSHKICASCLNNWQLRAVSKRAKNLPKWFKCPCCKEKTAFNAEEMKIDIFACACFARMKANVAARGEIESHVEGDYPTAEANIESAESFLALGSARRRECYSVVFHFGVSDTEDIRQPPLVASSRVLRSNAGAAARTSNLLKAALNERKNVEQIHALLEQEQALVSTEQFLSRGASRRRLCIIPKREWVSDEGTAETEADGGWGTGAGAGGEVSAAGCLPPPQDLREAVEMGVGPDGAGGGRITADVATTRVATAPVRNNLPQDRRGGGGMMKSLCDAAAAAVDEQRQLGRIASGSYAAGGGAAATGEVDLPDLPQDRSTADPDDERNHVAGGSSSARKRGDHPSSANNAVVGTSAASAPPAFRAKKTPRPAPGGACPMEGKEGGDEQEEQGEDEDVQHVKTTASNSTSSGGKGGPKKKKRKKSRSATGSSASTPGSTQSARRSDLNSRLEQVGVGSRVGIYWELDKTYYPATIIARHEDWPHTYTYLYDDGVWESFDLGTHHQFQVLDDAVPEAARAAIAAIRSGGGDEDGSAPINTGLKRARSTAATADGGGNGCPKQGKGRSYHHAKSNVEEDDDSSAGETGDIASNAQQKEGTKAEEQSSPKKRSRKVPERFDGQEVAAKSASFDDGNRKAAKKPNRSKSFDRDGKKESSSQPAAAGSKSDLTVDEISILLEARQRPENHSFPASISVDRDAHDNGSSEDEALQGDNMATGGGTEVEESTGWECPSCETINPHQKKVCACKSARNRLCAIPACPKTKEGHQYNHMCANHYHNSTITGGWTCPLCQTLNYPLAPKCHKYGCRTERDSWSDSGHKKKRTGIQRGSSHNNSSCPYPCCKSGSLAYFVEKNKAIDPSLFPRLGDDKTKVNFCRTYFTQRGCGINDRNAYRNLLRNISGHFHTGLDPAMEHFPSYEIHFKAFPDVLKEKLEESGDTAGWKDLLECYNKAATKFKVKTIVPGEEDESDTAETDTVGHA